MPETFLDQLIYMLWLLLKIVLILGPLILAVAYYTYFERKVIGGMQARIGPNRVGPKGLLQPFADVIKLLVKEVVVPSESNRYLFVIAPTLAITAALTLAFFGFSAPAYELEAQLVRGQP